MTPIGESAADVVVVGAGAAGCVLAARLVVAGRTVLLLESGADSDALENRLSTPGTLDPSADWGLVAEVVGTGTRVRLPRVRAVGGTSLLQGGIALRGLPADHDRWGAVAGPQWSHQGQLPFLRRLEHDEDATSPSHGTGGPVRIRRARPDEHQPLHRAFLDGCAELDLPWCDDLNSQVTTGFGLMPLARHGTRKVTARSAYLTPHRHDPRLRIRPGTHVVQVRTRGCGVHAVDTVDAAGRPHTYEAGTVVLAAGAVGSPLVLMRSGIGDPEALRAAGRPVRHALPGVGCGVRDHPATWTTFSLDEAGRGPDPLWFQVMLRHFRAEPTDQGAPGAAAGDSTRGDAAPGGLPDFAVEVFHDFRLLPSATAYRRGVLVVSLLEPRGTGRVRLSRDAADPVGGSVELDYGDPEDVAGLLAATLFGHRLLGSEAIRGLGIDRAQLVSVAGHGGFAPPGTPRWFALRTHRPGADTIRRAATTSHHLHGGCPMGPSDDPLAVVDERCGVHGVPGLYVADASVMPTLLRSNTHLLALSVGERVAALLSTEAR
ncbi:MAG: GMC family oxidoreductase [Actinobacteria bacterium]|nr:GMC family oxidoreductase [Actinomycetota bacterium]